MRTIRTSPMRRVAPSTITAIAMIASCMALSACGSSAEAVSEDQSMQRLASPGHRASTGDTIANPFDAASPPADASVAPTPAADASAPDAEAVEDGTGEPSTVAPIVEPTPIAPATMNTSAPSTPTGSCSDGKRVCGDMESCEDAVFHLQQCGMSRLDGDDDGTPCEKICG
jgi:hypothetical protein